MIRFYCLCALLLGTGCSGLTQQTGTVASNGVNIHYYTFGQGTPMVIINGGPGMSSDGFEAVAQLFASDHHCILFDQRGTGRSTLATPDSTNISMDLMIADMEALRKHLEIEQWIVFGHSFGGMLGAYYASQYPQRVKGMVFSSSGGVDLGLLGSVDVPGKLTEQQRDSLDFWQGKMNDGDTSYAVRLGRGRAMAPAYLFNPTYVPVIAERMTHVNRNVNSLVWQDMRSIDFDCKPALRDFAAPAIILQGKNDVLDVSVAKTIKQTLPNASLVLLDSCAHYGWLDQPEAYTQAIHGFLDELQE